MNTPKHTPHNLRAAIEYVNGAAERHYTYNTTQTARELDRAKEFLNQFT